MQDVVCTGDRLVPAFVGVEIGFDNFYCGELGNDPGDAGAHLLLFFEAFAPWCERAIRAVKALRCRTGRYSRNRR